MEIKFTPLPGSIEPVLNDFVQEQYERLREPTFRKYLAIVELLESSLNGYAYESLSEIERRRFEKAFEDGDERAFCHLFGPEKIPPHIPGFLYWFMLRKVFASKELLRAASTVTKRLLGGSRSAARSTTRPGAKPMPSRGPLPVTFRLRIGSPDYSAISGTPIPSRLLSRQRER